LGDRKDDTHMAEVAFCPLITERQVKEAFKGIQARVPGQNTKATPAVQSK
jgi:hypothetical protein